MSTTHPASAQTTPRNQPRVLGRFPLGVLPAFRRDPLGLFLRAARDGGDVVPMRFGPNVNYLINHPDGIQHVLQRNNRNYTRQTYGNELLKLISGVNLFTSDGEYWLRQRRLMQPAFHRSRIAGFGKLMTQAACRALERWEPAVDRSKSIDMQAEMIRLTMEVVGQSLFSVDLSDDTSTLGQSFQTSMEYFNYRLNHLLYVPLFIPTPRNRALKAALQDVTDFTQAMIDERRRTGEHKDDLLSMLLEARYEDTGEAMTDEQIRSELAIMIGAGHETTANALTWTFYLLSEHPEVETALHQELDVRLQGRIPTMVDLPNLDLNRRVLDESMRLYPPAWSLSGRLALEDDVVCGVRIPAGAPLLISPYVTHRDPRFWPDPERFDPDRFRPGQAEDRHRFAYLPFGGGPRKCIGDYFALIEAQLVLATLLSRVQLRVQPGYEVVPEPLFALRIGGGLPMQVSPR